MAGLDERGEVEVGTAVADQSEHDEPKGTALQYEPSHGMDVQKLMEQAIAKDGDGGVELMERLMDLRDRELAHQAERAFHEAFAQFKRTCPPIPRDKKGASFATQDGASREWVMYAPLETIQRIVDPLLFDLGFSYSWDSKATEKSVLTTCTLRHVSGHSVTSSMTLPISGPPKSSVTQASAGTRTFAKRLTLSDVLGIATDDDMDGADGGSGEPLTEDQLRTLRDLIAKREVDIDSFLGLFGVGSLADIPQASYGTAERFLKARKEKSSS